MSNKKQKLDQSINDIVISDTDNQKSNEEVENIRLNIYSKSTTETIYININQIKQPPLEYIFRDLENIDSIIKSII